MSAGYTIRDAARLANLPEHRVRAYVRAGLVAEEPNAPDAQRRPRLMFQDLLILRLASTLIAEGLGAAEVERSLRRLKAQLPADKPLSALRLRAEAGHVVVDDGQKLWEPATGQGRLRFDGARPSGVAEPTASPTDLPPRVAPTPQAPGHLEEAARWFETAMDLEEEAPQRAYEAYLHAIEVNPEHVEALINIGRLCAASGEVARAAAFFRQALRVEPQNPVAHFNLAVTQHDLGELEAARASYEAALASDPGFVDAHFNLAALLEQLGERTAALAHLQRYREIVEEPEA